MFKHVCACVYAYAFVLVLGEFCIKFIASHFPVLTLHFGSIFPLLIDFPYSTSETKKSSPKNLNVHLKLNINCDLIGEEKMTKKNSSKFIAKCISKLSK